MSGSVTNLGKKLFTLTNRHLNDWCYFEVKKQNSRSILGHPIIDLILQKTARKLQTKGFRYYLLNLCLSFN